MMSGSHMYFNYSNDDLLHKLSDTPMNPHAAHTRFHSYHALIDISVLILW